MKKLIVFAMIAAFMTFGGAAYADEELCGDITTIYEICLYESCTDDIPDQPCDVSIHFVTENGQHYDLDITACGTQINLALLKAFNNQGQDLPAEACLRYRFVVVDGALGVQFELIWICFALTV